MRMQFDQLVDETTQIKPAGLALEVRTQSFPTGGAEPPEAPVDLLSELDLLVCVAPYSSF